MNTAIFSLDAFVGILNEVKNMKADIICIKPNYFYNSSGNTCAFGIFGDSVYIELTNSGYAISYCGNDYYNALYNEGPETIMLESRLINPWLKLYKDSIDSIKKTNKEINKLYLETNLAIDYDTIWNTHIGRVLRYNSFIDPDYGIPLFYKDRYLQIQKNIHDELKFIIDKNKGHIEYNHIDITNDKEFNDIMSLKAADGGAMWYPTCLNNGNHKYCLTLSSNILNISKGDRVSITIYDLDYQPTFIAQFTVEKPKKKIVLNYYIKYFKIIR
jgi:hypothetical protein